MYVNSNLSLNYLPLLGGSSSASNNRLTWGAETLDVFNRPIGSARIVDLQPETPFAVKPANSEVKWGASQSATDSGYYDWVDAMVAFRKAADAGLGGNSSLDLDGLLGTQGQNEPAESGAATESGSAAGQETGEAEPPAETASSGSGSGSGSSTGTGGGGGLLGFLFGGR